MWIYGICFFTIFPYFHGYVIHSSLVKYLAQVMYEKTAPPLFIAFSIKYGFLIGFPKRWDSATFQDKRTEIPSLSRNKGTTEQAPNLTMAQDRPGKPVKIWDRTRDRIG